MLKGSPARGREKKVLKEAIALLREKHVQGCVSQDSDPRDFYKLRDKQIVSGKVAWNLARKKSSRPKIKLGFYSLVERKGARDTKDGIFWYGFGSFHAQLRFNGLLRRSKNRKRLTVIAKVQIIEQKHVFVHDLDLFVTVQFLDETQAVLSLHKLSSKRGHSYEWKAANLHNWPRMGRQLFVHWTTQYFSLYQNCHHSPAAVCLQHRDQRISRIISVNWTRTTECARHASISRRATIPEAGGRPPKERRAPTQELDRHAATVLTLSYLSSHLWHGLFVASPFAFQLWRKSPNPTRVSRVRCRCVFSRMCPRPHTGQIGLTTTELYVMKLKPRHMPWFLHRLSLLLHLNGQGPDNIESFALIERGTLVTFVCFLGSRSHGLPWGWGFGGVDFFPKFLVYGCILSPFAWPRWVLCRIGLSRYGRGRLPGQVLAVFGTVVLSHRVDLQRSLWCTRTLLIPPGTEGRWQWRCAPPTVRSTSDAFLLLLVWWQSHGAPDHNRWRAGGGSLWSRKGGTETVFWISLHRVLLQVFFFKELMRSIPERSGREPPPGRSV